MQALQVWCLVIPARVPVGGGQRREGASYTVYNTKLRVRPHVAHPEELFERSRPAGERQDRGNVFDADYSRVIVEPQSSQLYYRSRGLHFLPTAHVVSSMCMARITSRIRGIKTSMGIH